MLVQPSGTNLREKNREICVKAPTRVDLSGGTLDIWPLSCFFENSKTINFAIDGYVNIKIKDTKSNFTIVEGGKIFKFKNLGDLKNSKFRLYYCALSFFKNLKGIEIEIKDMAPKMSGLGSSSALLICILKGLFFLFNIRKTNKDLIFLSRDIEAKNMGYPTGTQDFYPPLYGGILCINYKLGQEKFEKLKGIQKIKDILLIYNTGVEHHSGRQNFEVFKEAIEKKDGKVWKNLKEIAKITNEMYKMFKRQNFKKIGKFMCMEWDLRRELSPSFNHPEIDKAIEVGKKNGAFGWKPCGAAGGGSIAFFVDEGKKEILKEKLSLLGGTVLPYNITGKGFEINYANR